MGKGKRIKNSDIENLAKNNNYFIMKKHDSIKGKLIIISIIALFLITIALYITFDMDSKYEPVGNIKKIMVAFFIVVFLILFRKLFNSKMSWKDNLSIVVGIALLSFFVTNIILAINHSVELNDAKIIERVVSDKSSVYGKSGSYEIITVNDIDPINKKLDIATSGRIYNAANDNIIVLIKKHKGLFFINWYETFGYKRDCYIFSDDDEKSARCRDICF